MAYESNVEDLLESLRGDIETNIATYVTGINTAKGDGLTLPAIASVTVQDPDPYDAATLPAAMLDAEDVITEPLDSGHDVLIANVLLVLAIQEDDNQRTRLHRYSEALRQCLIGSKDRGDVGFDVNPRQPVVIQYYGVLDGVAVASVRFQVLTDVPR